MKRIIKVFIPRVVTDMPMATFRTHDRSWQKEVPVTSQLIQWLDGKHEAYFEMTIEGDKIVNMIPVDSKEFYGCSGEEMVDA